jgi:hypothetical protein
MKKIIILTAMLIAAICKAQTPEYTLGTELPNNIPDGCYIKDNNNILGKFTGTWVFNQNGNLFTVNLSKGLMVPIADHYRDDIQGNYKYVVNNATIVNTDNFSGNNSRIKTTFLNFGTEKIALFFYDPERPKIGARVFLTYSNVGGVEKLHWELKVMGYLPQLPNEPPAQLDFRVPTNCELIKQ